MSQVVRCKSKSWAAQRCDSDRKKVQRCNACRLAGVRVSWEAGKLCSGNNGLASKKWATRISGTQWGNAYYPALVTVEAVTSVKGMEFYYYSDYSDVPWFAPEYIGQGDDRWDYECGVYGFRGLLPLRPDRNDGLYSIVAHFPKGQKFGAGSLLISGCQDVRTIPQVREAAGLAAIVGQHLENDAVVQYRGPSYGPDYCATPWRVGGATRYACRLFGFKGRRVRLTVDAEMPRGKEAYPTTGELMLNTVSPPGSGEGGLRNNSIYRDTSGYDGRECETVAVHGAVTELDLNYNELLLEWSWSATGEKRFLPSYGAVITGAEIL